MLRNILNLWNCQSSVISILKNGDYNIHNNFYQERFKGTSQTSALLLTMNQKHIFMLLFVTYHILKI